MSNKPRFLYPEIPEVGQICSLSREESHHLARVLRLRAGESIVLIDGRGTSAEAKLETNDAKGAQALILNRTITPLSKKVSLAFSIPKGPALESILKKCTEIGTVSFQPLVTDHSLHPDKWNQERWEKQILEACKQCEDPWAPSLETPLALTDYLSKRDTAKTLLFCDEESREKKDVFLESLGADILIGAEGGWSEKERALLSRTSHVSLGLGKNRLRADTAAMTALVIVKSLFREI